MVVGQFVLCITLLGSILLANNPLRSELERFLLCGKRTRKPWLYYTLTVGIFVGVTIFVIFFPKAVDYLTFVGGISVVPLTIILPTIIYYKISHNVVPLILITIWSIILSIVGFSSPIKTIVNI
mmetsp:Transcript_24126/g.4034  ORF Transcript_24126/g.4034 Transcript_24126/m.4034 type:complete len:124 (+) Transcript_24126:934-1305(+)